MQRAYQRALPVQLTSNASKSKSFTVSTAGSSFIFEMSGLPDKARGKFWRYVTAICVQLTITLDQAASGGTAINRDKLWKFVRTFHVTAPRLTSPLFDRAHVRGAAMGAVVQVLGNGFRHPRDPDDQIAAADGDTTVTLLYRLPVAWDFLDDPMDTAHLITLFEKGALEVAYDTTTVFDGDSTGLVVESAGTARAWFETVGIAGRPYVPGRIEVREYTTAAAKTATLTQFGQQPSGCNAFHRVPFFALLGNPTGIGLDSIDTLNDLTEIQSSEWDIENLEAPEALIDSMKDCIGSLPQNNRTTVNTNLRWPNAFADTVGTAPLTAGLYVFPLAFPGMGQQLTKCKGFEGSGDHRAIDKSNWGSLGTANQRFLALHAFDYNDAWVAKFREDWIPEAPGAQAIPKSSGSKSPLSPAAAEKMRGGVKRVFFDQVRVV